MVVGVGLWVGGGWYTISVGTTIVVSSSVDTGGGGVGFSGSGTGVVVVVEVDVSSEVVVVVGVIGLDDGIEKALLVVVGFEVGMPVPQEEDSDGGKIPVGMDVGIGMVLLMETVGKLETGEVGVTVALEDGEDGVGNSVGIGSGRVGSVKAGGTSSEALTVSSTDEVGADELVGTDEDTVVAGVDVELSRTGAEGDRMDDAAEEEGTGDDVVDRSDEGSIQSGKPGKVGITLVKSSLDVSTTLVELVALVTASVVVVPAVPTAEEKVMPSVTLVLVGLAEGSSNVA